MNVTPSQKWGKNQTFPAPFWVKMMRALLFFLFSGPVQRTDDAAHCDHWLCSLHRFSGQLTRRRRLVKERGDVSLGGLAVWLYLHLINSGSVCCCFFFLLADAKEVWPAASEPSICWLPWKCQAWQYTYWQPCWKAPELRCTINKQSHFFWSPCVFRS